ncbi:MAG: tandem-95 repeat protein [Gemmataceae bacterium]
MSHSWLRQLFRRWFRRPSPTAPIRRPRPRFRFGLEEVEDRVVPATITWTNAAGGNWHVAANWDLGRVPVAGDDVVIPDLGATGADLTITTTANNVPSLGSLTTLENITAGNFGLSGNLALNGGATISMSGNAAFSFDSASTATVQQVTTTGGGKFALNNGDLRQITTAHTVRFGSGVTVTGAGRIGGQAHGTWENFGTWTGATTANGTTLSLIDGSTFVNQPGGVWSVATGTLTLGGVWSNAGTIVVAGGTLNLGGSFAGSSVSDPGRFTRSGGTVNLTGSLTGDLSLSAATGSWNLVGGTISGGTITTANGTALTATTSATLSNARIDGTVNMTYTGNGSPLTIVGDLVVNGELVTNDLREVWFSAAGGATQNVTGTGRIRTSGRTGYVQSGGAHTVAFGSGFTLTGAGVGTDATTVGAVPAGSVAGTWTNAGTWATGGGSLTLGTGTFTNLAGGTWSVAGGTFTTAGTWQNNGTFTLNNGTLNLGGTFTQANLGSWTRSGSTVNLTGTLTGGLSLDSTTGSWNLAGGTISGGTITTANGTALTATTSATLSNARIDGTVNMTYTGNSLPLTIVGDLVVNGELVTNDLREVWFSAAGGATQNVTGTGRIRTSGRTGYVQSGGAHTVAFGSGFTLTGAGVGTDATTVGAVPAGSVAGTWTNAGTWATGGGSLTLGTGTFTNLAGGTWSAAGGTFTTAASWSNAGTLAVSAGTLNLGGSFTTASVANFSRTGGAVNLTGTLTNTGATLALGTANNGRGTWTLSGGTVRGGSVATSGGAVLQASSGTLDGVTVAAGSELVVQSGGQVTVTNGLTVDGKVTLGAGTGATQGLQFAGTQTLGGSGEVAAGAGTQGLWLTQSNTTLTVGPGVWVHGGYFVIGAGTAAGVTGTGLVNQGLIEADAGTGAGVGLTGFYGLPGVASFTNAAGGRLRVAAAGAVLNVGGASITNAGSVAVSAGAANWGVAYNQATALWNTSTWTNTGNFNVSGGTLYLGGTFATAAVQDPGRFTRTGGTVNITGTMTNFGRTFLLDDATGNWTLNGGGINGGAFALAPNTTSKLFLGSARSFLYNGVTLNSPIDTTAVANGELYVTGTLTLNSTLTLTGDLLRFDDPTQTLRTDGGGTVVLSNGNITGFNFTIAPGVTVRGGWGSITANPLTNQGTVSADEFVSGQLLGVNIGNGGRNEGLMRAVSGGSLEVRSNSTTGTWTNVGTIAGTGGTINLGFTATESWSSPGTISLVNTTITLKSQFGGSAFTNFTRTGGSVVVTGTVTGGLTLSDLIGDLTLSGATISGGTIDRAAGSTARLFATGTSTVLAGVTLNVPVDLTQNTGAAVRLTGSLVLNATMPIGSATGAVTAGVWADTSLTVSTTYVPGVGPGTGYGRFVLGPSASNFLDLSTNNSTLTIAPNVTVETRGGRVGRSSLTITLVNQGTIESGPGVPATVYLGTGGVNFGTVRANPGSALALDGPGWTNAPGGTITATSATLTTNSGASAYTNLGTLDATDSVVNLGGSFTQAALGSFSRTRGQVNLTGTLGGDLALDDATGSWRLAGGTIQDSRVRTDGAATLIGTELSGVLSRVTLDGRFTLPRSAGGVPTVQFSERVTVNSSLQIGDATGTYAATIRPAGGPLTIDGTGEIIFGGSGSNAITGVVGAGALTIGPAVKIRGKNGLIASVATIDLQGSVVADGAGGTITVRSSLTPPLNRGLVRAENGGTVAFHAEGGPHVTNVTPVAGVGDYFTLTGGRWEAGSNSNLHFIYGDPAAPKNLKLRNLDATLVLDAGSTLMSRMTNGATSDALTHFAGIAAGGSLTLAGGRSLTPATTTVTSAGNLTLGAGSTFGLPRTLPLTAPTTAGMVGQWKGEGTANDSVGANHGTVTGAVGYAAGQVGQGFTFSGGYVTVPAAPALDLTSSLTLAGWVYLTGNNFNNGIIYKGAFNGSQGVYSFGFFTGGSNRLSFRLNGSTAEGAGQATGATALAVGQWYHVAAVYNQAAGTQKIYVNGVEDISRPYSAAVGTTAGPLVLGGYYSSGFLLNGQLDEVGVYNRALSPAELTELTQYRGTVGTTVVQTGGTTTVNGTLVAPGGASVAAGATFKGAGTVQGSLTNAGTVAPGNSPGFLNVTGDYTQAAGGTLELEVAGRNPNVPEFDRLRVTGTAYLDGTVRVNLLDGFQPALGDNFQVLTAAARVGQFAAHEYPAPGGAGRALKSVYDPGPPLLPSSQPGLLIQTQQLPPVDFGSVAVGGPTVLTSGSVYAPFRVVLDAAGNTYVAGLVAGTIDFDLSDAPDALDTLTATGGGDGFLAKYDAAGAFLWVRAIDASLAGYATGLAIDPRGTADPADDWVYVTGVFSSTVTYAGASLGVAGPGPDVFLLKTDAAGARLAFDSLEAFTSGFPAAAGPVPVGPRVAVAPNGDVVVTGGFRGTIDVDPGAGTTFLIAAGNSDAYVVQLTPALGFVRAGRVGGAGVDDEQTVDVAVDAAGDVWVTGTFRGTTTGLAALTAVGGSDVFLLKLRGSGTGFTTLFARGYGGVGDDDAGGVAVTPDGDGLVAGTFRYAIDFDPAPARSYTIVSGGDRDAFVARLSGSGEFRWAEGFGGYRDDAVNDLRTDAAGNAYFAGSFTDTVDFDPLAGTYYLSTAPGTAAQGYVAKLTPAGEFLLAVPVGGQPTSAAAVWGAAVGADGRVAAAGTFRGAVDFDPGPADQIRTLALTNANAAGGFVLQLRQKAAPAAVILGAPAGAVPEGTTLGLGVSVADADSAYFTYAWSVRRGSDPEVTGTGPAFTAQLADQGVYVVTVTVTDEAGNADTRTTTVTVVDAAAALNPTAFGPSSAAAVAGAAAGDALGSSLAVGGGYRLVGAPGRTVGGFASAGAVRVFDGTGALVRTLDNPAPAANARFGAAVAVVGTRAVVGAPGAGVGGLAYVFDLATGGLVQTLAGPGPAAGDRFGAAVGALGGLVAVGAPGRGTVAGSAVGEAYVFDPLTGLRLRVVRNPTPAPDDEFGTAVAAVGANLLVGAPGDDTAGANAGAAYLFDPGTARVVAALLNPNPLATPTTGAFASRFGASLAASGLRAAVGAPTETYAGTANAGRVYLFDLDPASAKFGANVRAFNNPAAGAGWFGRSVALAGNRLLVGATAENASPGAGVAVLLDTEPNTSGAQVVIQSLTKTGGAAGDRFGAAVGFAGDDVLVGASGDDAAAADAGGLYRFAGTVAAFATTTVGEGGTVTVAGSFTDPGTADGHTVLIDWGAGEATTRLSLAAGVYTFTAAHLYPDDNPTGTGSDVYPVRVRVLDQTGDVLVADLAPAAADRFIRADAATGAGASTLIAAGAVAGATEVAGVQVGPDGLLYVAYAGGTNPVVRFDPATGQLVDTFVAAGSSYFDQRTGNLAFGRDGTLYQFAPGSGGLYLSRVAGPAGGTITAVTDPASIFSSTFAAPAGQRAFAVGPDGNLYVARSTATAGVVEKYSAATGLSLGVVASSATGFQPSAVNSIRFAADGTMYVLSASAPGAADRLVAQIDPATGTLLRTFPLSAGGGSFPDHIAIGAGNVLYYSSGNPAAPAVRRFDLTTGAELAPFAGLGLTAGGYVIPLGTQDAALTNLTVTNTAPTVTVRAAAAAGGTYTLSAVVGDVGVRDTFTYSWAVTAGTATVVGGTTGSSFGFTPTGAVTVSLTVTDDDGGTLTTATRVVFGTSAAETITITNTTSAVGGAAAVSLGSVGRVIVFGLDGNDLITASGVTSFPVELVGGAGADTLVGGSRADVLTADSPGGYGTSLATATDDHAADSLSGAAGNDTLDGGLGNDTLAGGNDDDWYIEVPGSDDLLTESGTTGIDRVDYSLAYFGVTFSLDPLWLKQVVNPAAPLAEQHTVQLLGAFENLTGSGYGDVLSGNALDNAVAGGAGNDQVFGGDRLNLFALFVADGADTLEGGAGNDTVDGGAGNDGIFGGDRLAFTLDAGQTDDDSLVGGLGNDTVDGGAGNDGIFGGDRLAFGLDTTLAGVPDNDSLVGGWGNDTVDGGAGNDGIFGGDRLAFSAPYFFVGDDDSLVGGLGNDTVDGGAGNDGIFGGDRLALTLDPVAAAGLADHDSLVGGWGNDTVDGGAGNDGIFGGDRLTFAFDPYGVSLPDNDSLVGGLGNDTVDGGAGNDGIFGGDRLAFTSDLAALGLPDDDSLVGGVGNDTVDGGAGNDGIFGGDRVAFTFDLAALGLTDDDSLVGGLGNDTVDGGAGNDGIFGGDRLAFAVGLDAPASVSDDDSLVGGLGNDTVDGGAGNDGIFGGDRLALTLDPLGLTYSDNDSLFGGAGNDTVDGGAGNDGIFGGEGDDVLTGGAGTDLFEGGSGLDALADAADADVTLAATTVTIAGVVERFYDVERAALAGGAGNNRIDAGGFGGPVSLTGGAGNDTLVGTAYGDTLVAGAGSDSLVGGAGADTLDLGPGPKFADGGADNDLYLVPMGGVVTLTDASGIDTVDLGAAPRAVRADLPAGLVTDGTGAAVVFAAGTFVENVTGTTFSDTLKGTADRNILWGGGGLDVIDGGDGDDTLQGSFPQVVYLDFDAATGPGEHAYTVEERNLIQARLEAVYPAPFNVTFTQGVPGTGRYSTLVVNGGDYAENELVLGGDVDALDFRNTDPAAGGRVNATGFLGRAGQAAATSENYVAFTAAVAAHELAHLFGLRHSDSFGPVGTNPATGLPYGVSAGLFLAAVSPNETAGGVPVGLNQVAYPLKHGLVAVAPRPQTGATVVPFYSPLGVIYEGNTPVARFTVTTAGAVQLTHLVATPRVAGATLDATNGIVTVNWVTTPVGTKLIASYQYSPFRPVYDGPADAGETARHITASPASVGSTVADALGATYLGERELIKLAFADASTTRNEAALPVRASGTPLPAPVAAQLGAGGLVRDLGTMPLLAVPNLLPAGTMNAGRLLNVRAGGVVGSIGLNTVSRVSENDVYAVQGKAGDLLTVEVLSVTLRARISNTIDGVVRVYDAAGNLLTYYGRPAENDDGFDNSDPLLQDVRLPADGTYYVVVDTYTGPGVPDTDTGGYELLLYSYPAPGAPGPNQLLGVGPGDSVVGGAGADVLVGSTGVDRLVGFLPEDTIIGATPADVVAATLDPAAAVTVALTPALPAPTAVLTATATPLPDSVNASLTFVWSVDGVVRRTVTGAALTDQYDPAAPGQALAAGQVVVVMVTPQNATGTGDAAVAAVLVGATPPTVQTSQTITATEDAATARILAVTSPGGAPVTGITLTQAPQYGTLTFDPVLLLVVYTPTANYSGTDTFRYTATTAAGTSAEAAVTVNVVGTNDAPTTTAPAAVAAVEDTPVSLTGVTVGDLDSAIVTITLTAAAGTLTVGAVAGGTVTGNGTGTVTVTGSPAAINAALAAAGGLTYTGAANATGTDAVTLTVADNDATKPLTAATKIAVTLAAVNDVPVALPATLTATEDTPLVGQVAVADADSGAFTYTLVGGSAPANGTSTLTTTAGTLVMNVVTGTYTYTPAANYTGPVTFSYLVNDGTLDSTAATTTIGVAAVNDTPTAVAQAATVLEDGTLAGQLAATDPDLPAQTLTFSLVAGSAANGTAVVNPNGTFTFTPAANFNGTASFQFTASDGLLASAAATVTITVTAVNDAPTFAGGDVTVLEDSGAYSATWATGVSAGPADESGQSLTFTTGTTNAALFAAAPQVSAAGVLTFTPAANAFGTATVTVTLTDGGGTATGGANSTVRTFTLTVSSVNDAPAFTVGGSVTVAEDSGAYSAPWATALSAGPANESAQALAFVVTSDNAALFAVAPAVGPTGVLTFTPAANANGTATVTVRLTDSGGTANGGTDTSAAQTFAITVTAVNDAPTAATANRTTLEDTAVDVDLAALVGDVETAPTNLTFTVGGAVTGAVALLADGRTARFTPAANANGAGSFTYSVTDASDGASPALTTGPVTVTVLITPVNDAPGFAAGGNVTVAENAGPYSAAWATALAAGPANESAQTLAFVVSNNNGALFAVQPALNPAGVLTFTPAANATGTATVTVRLTDTGGTANGGIDSTAPQTFTITLTAVNDAPTAVNDAFTVAEDATLAGTVTGNDFDVDSPGFTAAVVTGPAHGTLALAADGGFTYAPAANYFGTDTFTYRLNDGQLDGNVATVTITVTAVNDAPAAAADAVTTREDGAVVVPVLGNDTDADGDALAVAAVTPPAHGVVALSAGVVTYTPAADYFGSDGFTYTVSDGHGGTSTAAVVVTVSPVNDAPTFTGGGDVTVLEDAAGYSAGWATGVSAGPGNESGQTLAFVVTTTNAALFAVAPAISSGGVLTFTPAANASGTATVTVRLTDDGDTANGGLDSSAAQTFVVTVTAVNDAPTIAGTAADQPVTDQTTLRPFAAVTVGDVDGDALTLTVALDDYARGTLAGAGLGGTGPYTLAGSPAAVTAALRGLVFTPAANRVAPGLAEATAFTLTVTDGAATAAAAASVVATSVNDAPAAAAASLSATEDGAAVTTAVLTDDADTDDDAASLTYAVTQPAEGTATSLGGGVFRFDPGAAFQTLAAGATRVVAFTYTATDRHGAATTGAVTVTVTGTNDAPTLTGPAAASTAENTVAVATYTAADADAGSTLTFGLAGADAVRFDLVAAGANTYELRFKAAPDFEAPADADGDNVYAVTVTATDGTAPTSRAVLVTVTNANDTAPVVTSNGGGAAAAAGVAENTTAVTTVTAADPDGPLTPLTFSVAGGADAAKFTIDATTGALAFAAAPDFEAPASAAGSNVYLVTVRVSDGTFTAQQALSVTVTNTNDTAPVAAADAVTVSEDAAATAVPVLANDTDADGSPLVVTAVTQPGAGAVVLSGGVVTYTPPADYFGATAFTYTVSDGVFSRTGTVTVTVTPVNDAPTFTGGGDVAVLEDAAGYSAGWATGVSAGPGNESGQAVGFVVTTTSAGLFAVAPAVSPTGVLTFTPAADASGTATVTVRLADDGGTAGGGVDTSAARTFTITVTAVNDAPTAAAGTLAVTEDTAATGQLTAADIDSGALTYELVTAPTRGTVTLNAATGAYTYTPNANATGADSFTFRAGDGALWSNVATVAVSIAAVNDAPAAAVDAVTTRRWWCRCSGTTPTRTGTRWRWRR